MRKVVFLGFSSLFLLALACSPLNSPLWGGAQFDFGHRGRGLSFSPFGSRGRSHIGIFPMRGRNFSQPFLGESFFGAAGRRGLQLGFQPTRRGLFFGGGAFSRFGSPPLQYTSKKFISEWSSRQPFEQTEVQGFSDSARLRIGMDFDAVARIVGTPLSKFRAGRRELWKYSAYTLVFEDGALAGIR